MRKARRVRTESDPALWKRMAPNTENVTIAIGCQRPTVVGNINALEEDPMNFVHLPEVDYPQTINILTKLLAHKDPDGFVRWPGGADVDWDDLGSSGLSTTENATLEMAHGLSTVERCGGFPGDGSVWDAIAEAVKQLR